MVDALGGTPLDELYERQYSGRPSEVSPNLSLSAIWRLATAPALATTPEEAARLQACWSATDGVDSPFEGEEGYEAR